ncbi:helix-turn-helix transcriptional regulator [Salinarimonas ramus]|uniref:HTH cro/C1-type domain-containing protein n=1 Tax=Salinarimonas ramus TaxID=690164 RepID=A0A917V2N8_9HYPH|nr:hypothetical protein [Salinarimonas ramus]GGK24600.1 hypothetical protein GCM10011322_09010 [Salinarimonas ramus]
MPTSTFAYEPDYVVTPCEVLAEHLEALALTPRAFADRSGIPLARIEAFLAGDDAIDAELAQRLASGSGVSAEIWGALDERRRRSAPDSADGWSEVPDRAPGR